MNENRKNRTKRILIILIVFMTVLIMIFTSVFVLAKQKKRALI